MYNDTIKVANKIIVDKDLMDIFQKMYESIKENEKICEKETRENEKYELEFQHWTTKDFEGNIKGTFNFYDDTTITVDNYKNFITIFNNRLHEVKDVTVRLYCSYWIKDGVKQDMISQYINMYIQENKMDIEVSLSSKDKRLDNIYKLIKDKIIKAPTRYNRIIRKRKAIISKIEFSLGVIPSLIICTLLVFIPSIRESYALTYVLFPVVVLLLAFIIGNVIFGGKLNNLYSNLIPEKKYEGYDLKNNMSIYKDDVDQFIKTSEIIIGKNIYNIRKRREISRLEKKYSEYIPYEIVALVVLSIIVVLIGKLM